MHLDALMLIGGHRRSHELRQTDTIVVSLSDSRIIACPLQDLLARSIHIPNLGKLTRLRPNLPCGICGHNVEQLHDGRIGTFEQELDIDYVLNAGTAVYRHDSNAKFTETFTGKCVKHNSPR